MLIALSLFACTKTGGGGGDDTAANPDAWILGGTPCTGSEASAMHCDDASTCYVGCGENAVGQGLWVTTDGGETWGEPDDEAGGYFATFRVMHLSRGDDGALYVAGEGGSGYRVVSLDTGSGALGVVYENISNIDYSMSAGSFAMNDEVMVAESLTGTQVVVNHFADSAWQATYEAEGGWGAGYGWWNNSGSSDHVQVLDMTVVDGEILGVGSTINYPPVVYLPPRSFGFGTSSGGEYVDQMWEAVILNEDAFSVWTGECWGIDGNSDGLALACTDQDGDRGMVYTIGNDWASSAYTPGNWTETDMSTIVSPAVNLGHSTWTKMVCRGPDNLVAAVGVDSQTEDGWLAVSSDGGVSWVDHTDAIDAAWGDDLDLPALTQCQVVDGYLVAAGPGVMVAASIDDI